MSEMKMHPDAADFPAMSVREYTDLKNDIKENGVREPIWVWHGVTLDGRHRLRACNELGFHCPSREWPGKEEDIFAFVWSVNKCRRHLNASQLSMLAAKKAFRDKGRLSTKNSQSVESNEERNPPKGGMTQPEAAALVGATVRSTQRATDVLKHGSKELIEAVEEATIHVTKAAEIAKTTPKKDQARAAKAKPNGTAKPPTPPKAAPLPVDTVSKNEFNKIVDDFNALNEEHQALQDRIQAYEDVRADKSVAVIEGLRGQLRVCHSRRDELMNKSAGDEKAIILLQRKLKKFEAQK